MRIFQDIRRHFMVGHGPRLAFGFVCERAHAAGDLICLRLRVCFEEEPAFVNDAKDLIAAEQGIRAEHGTGADIWQTAQLVEHKFFEGVVGHFPAS